MAHPIQLVKNTLKLSCTNYAVVARISERKSDHEDFRNTYWQMSSVEVARNKLLKHVSSWFSTAASEHWGLFLTNADQSTRVQSQKRHFNISELIDNHRGWSRGFVRFGRTPRSLRDKEIFKSNSCREGGCIWSLFCFLGKKTNPPGGCDDWKRSSHFLGKKTSPLLDNPGSATESLRHLHAQCNCNSSETYSRNYLASIVIKWKKQSYCQFWTNCVS